MAARLKYGNAPTVVDGHTFASKAEAKRYGELKLLEQAGEIYGLELQPRFKIIVNGKQVATYVADFGFFDKEVRRVIDVKGVETPVFKLKRRLVEALYPGLKIEVEAA